MIINLTGNFLNKEVIDSNLNNTYTIVGEPVEAENKFNPERPRLIMNVRLNTGLKAEFSCNVNKTSQKQIIKVLGNDTKNWLNKVVKIYTLKTAVNGEVLDMIVLEPLPLDKQPKVVVEDKSEAEKEFDAMMA